MELANKNLSYVKLWQYIVTFDKNSVFSTAKITVCYTLGLLRWVKGTNWSVFNILTVRENLSFSDPQTCSMNYVKQKLVGRPCLTERTEKHWTLLAGQLQENWMLLCPVHKPKMHHLFRSFECGTGIWIRKDWIFV